MFKLFLTVFLIVFLMAFKVFLNGVSQYTTIHDEIWSNTTNSYVPLDLATLEMTDILLDPVTGLENGDMITIDVTMPNGTNDTDPTNNQTITYEVDLGFDNAYWDGALSIDVDGGPQNSWYLKKVSNNLIIASGYGGVTGATNSIPLAFNECYTLESINGDNLAYTVTDAQGQIILDGVASGVEDFDNFTTGNQIWTSASLCTDTITVVANIQNISCHDYNDGQIGILATGGFPPYSFYLDGVLNTNPFPLDSSFLDLSAGTYNITVVESSGCVIDTSVTITQPSTPLQALVSGNMNICFGSNLIICLHNSEPIEPPAPVTMTILLVIFNLK